MSKQQITGIDSEAAEKPEAFVGNIMTDWEVDREGNAYSVADKLREELAELKDEFKENN